VRELAAQGKAVVLITHKIADVTACADRIAVMRRGRLIDESRFADRSPAAIITAMVGQAVVPEPADPPPTLELGSIGHGSRRTPARPLSD
jgi:general nucleoside transport system ATP-binding protein